MYDQNQIKEVENGLLLIFTYFIFTKMDFNSSEKVSIDEFFEKVNSAKSIIVKTKTQVLNLSNLRHEEEIDFQNLTEQLNVYGVTTFVSKTYTNVVLWNEILDIMIESGFSGVFSDFWNKLNEAESLFDEVNINYEHLSERQEIVKNTLLQLEALLLELTSSLQATMMMLEYIKKENLFETCIKKVTTTPEPAPMVVTRHLKLVFSNKDVTN